MYRAEVPDGDGEGIFMSILIGAVSMAETPYCCYGLCNAHLKFLASFGKSCRISENRKFSFNFQQDILLYYAFIDPISQLRG